MTQYTEILWGSSDGAFPSSVLTKRIATSDENVVACNANSEAEGGFTFEQDWSADDRRLNSLDAIDGDANRDDIELLARFQINEASLVSHQYGLAARYSGTDDDETGYELWTYETTANVFQLRLTRMDAGVGSTLATSANITPHVNGDWYYIRFRVNGTSLQGRLWPEGDEEPTVWHIDETNSDVSGVGWGGILGFEGSSGGLCETDMLTIGTNGDAAPLAASTTSTLRVTAAYAAVLSSNPDIPVRISAAYAAVLSTNPDGPVRISAAYVSVLYGATPPPPPPPMDNIIKNKKNPGGGVLIPEAEVTETQTAQVTQTASSPAGSTQGGPGKGGPPGEVIINLPPQAGGPFDLDTHIEGYDFGSDTWYNILTGANITAGSTQQRLRVGTTVANVANLSANDVLPYMWRVRVEHGDATAVTYSVEYKL